jgi:uroporphyrin-III C-methyltransferase
MAERQARVFIVGAGPGGIDLLTVRALRLIEQAEVVLFDALVDSEVVALAQRALRLSVGKRAGHHSMKQPQINALLVQHARSGKIVVRLKGGDPAIFGRLDEELDVLRAAGIPFEVVPGVTTASAAAAALQTSLTTRGVARQVSFVTPSQADQGAAGEFDGLSILPGATTVFYMAGRLSRSLGQALLRNGFQGNAEVAVIRNVARANQEIGWVSVAMLAVRPDLPWPQAHGPVILIAGLRSPTELSSALAHHISGAGSGDQSPLVVMQRHLN